MFDELDFLYCPSRDVAADVAHYTDGLGGELVWAISAFNTRVAMVRFTSGGPKVLLAEHLHGEQPIMVFRVTELVAAEADLKRRGVAFSGRFGFPDGIGIEVENPGPQRIAVYEQTHPDRGKGLVGRRDF